MNPQLTALLAMLELAGRALPFIAATVVAVAGLPAFLNYRLRRRQMELEAERQAKELEARVVFGLPAEPEKKRKGSR
jgi:hypothetical protein